MRGWMACALVWGCSGPEPLRGQFGEEEQIRCEETSRTPVADDAVITLAGYDGDVDVDIAVFRASAAQVATHPIHWMKTGEIAEITATLSRPGSADHVVYDNVGSQSEGPGTDAAIFCPDRLELPVSLVVVTSDGRLDESVETVAETLGEQLYVEAEISQLAGSLDVVALSEDPEVRADEVRVHLSLGEVFSGYVEPLLLSDPEEDVAPLAHWPFEEVEAE
ncbi:MAG: hypothetical protein KTR31_34095 [Myxococcales bacterium]|nr:hypothetical protein [Myxococcales bacterium]